MAVQAQQLLILALAAAAVQVQLVVMDQQLLVGQVGQVRYLALAGQAQHMVAVAVVVNRHLHHRGQVV